MAEEDTITLTDEDVAALSYLNGQLRVGMECAYAPNNWQESEASDTNVPIENVPGAYAEGYDVQIARIIADQLGVVADDITLETNLTKDLEADSLDAVEIIMAIEDEYGIEIPDEEAETIQTVADLVRFVEENK